MTWQLYNEGNKPNCCQIDFVQQLMSYKLCEIYATTAGNQDIMLKMIVNSLSYYPLEIDS